MRGIGGEARAIDDKWANVKLLLPFRGPNNSTAIEDAKGLSVTVGGGAKLSTAQYPSGCTSSLVLDGNNDYLIVSSAGLAFGTGDFAIEIPVYKAGDTVTGNTNSAYIVDFRTAEPSVNVNMYVYGSADATKPNKVALYVNGADRIVSTTSVGASWKNVTLARVSGVTRLFIDGVQEGGNYTDTNNYTATVANISARHGALSGDYRSFNGYFGPMRITANGRGYSANFTPPTLPFLQPTISGVVLDASAAPVAKRVIALKRSTQTVAGTALSDAGTGLYAIYPVDYSEHQVYRADASTYPLVDGGSGENALIYDRVIPGG